MFHVKRLWLYSIGRIRGGLNRVRGAVIPNLQAAIAATIAWMICHAYGDPNPIFAPIATFICMGFSRNRQPGKVIEIGLGASFGVLIGAIVGHYWGFNWIQLVLLLSTTTLVGRFIHRSEFVAFQTAINAIVVASMMPLHTTSTPLDRLLNALVGAAVALLATIVIPTDVLSRPRRYTVFGLQEMARTLRRLSRALRDGDAQAIAELRGRLTSIREQMNDARLALNSAQETSAISPTARGVRPQLAELDRLLTLIERMHVSVSMLRRQARHMVTETGPMPELSQPLREIADLLDRVARGVEVWQRPTDARDDAVALAAHLGPDEVADAGNWRSTVLVSITRALLVDLMQLTGLSLAQARGALADTKNFDPDCAQEVDTEADLPSVMWGTEMIPAVDDNDPHPCDEDGLDPRS